MDYGNGVGQQEVGLLLGLVVSDLPHARGMYRFRVIDAFIWSFKWSANVVKAVWHGAPESKWRVVIGHLADMLLPEVATHLQA